MSILEAALERAKRDRAEQQREGAIPGQTNAGSPARRQRLDVSSVPVPNLKFAGIEIDAATCEKNRILLGAPSGRSDSQALDSYRILRTRVRRRIATQDMTSIGFFSMGAGEGKSLTSLNLALAFAREKRQNVFLLDLDLRSPSICRKLGVAPKMEIGSYLSNPASPAELFFTIGVDNLAVAAGTTSHENSSE